ncbi:phospholipase A [Flagellatimonas centrodinii]|uniref:phospholipase A n=1 Tax=Flagellatimonas centrodinii TaxID=2806210 RepID=UPI001EFC14EC|nr:phospholipase A [Flagellatimonas centrodinii]ULQ47080.1 phospholipase A [Flagellatimonas centrodinii]
MLDLRCNRTRRRLAGLMVLLPSLAMAESPSPGRAAGPQPLLADPPAANASAQARDPAAVGDDFDNRDGGFLGFQRQAEDAYSIISVARGLSTHKPMYLLPVAYSPNAPGLDTEVLFQISAKQKLFASPWYFGYTQKSFWQVYDEGRSRPFRETNYNPELFYRWTPDPERWHHWGADFGIEHESNGQDVPMSRSWNRLYIAPFQAKGQTLRYLKFWYRIPEERKDSPGDPKGDDNPLIHRFFGYAEANVQRQLDGGGLAHLMLRGNPSTGKGAVLLNFTWPSADGYVFYMVQLFHGYGESLIDYDRSITRIGLGFALAR